MSGDRQWAIEHSPLWAFPLVTSGPLLTPGETVDVVEASRLTAVEAERDALREVVEHYAEPTNHEGDMSACPWYRGEGTCGGGCRDEPACQTGEPLNGWPSAAARAVLVRFPKNETEQG